MISPLTEQSNEETSQRHVLSLLRITIARGMKIPFDNIVVVLELLSKQDDQEGLIKISCSLSNSLSFFPLLPIFRNSNLSKVGVFTISDDPQAKRENVLVLPLLRVRAIAVG